MSHELQGDDRRVVLGLLRLLRGHQELREPALVGVGGHVAVRVHEPSRLRRKRHVDDLRIVAQQLAHEMVELVAHLRRDAHRQRHRVGDRGEERARGARELVGPVGQGATE